MPDLNTLVQWGGILAAVVSTIVGLGWRIQLQATRVAVLEKRVSEGQRTLTALAKHVDNQREKLVLVARDGEHFSSTLARMEASIALLGNRLEAQIAVLSGRVNEALDRRGD